MLCRILKRQGLSIELISLSTQLIAHSPNRLGLDGGRPHVGHPRYGPHHPEHPDLETEEGG